MKTVWKYEIKLGQCVPVPLPPGARALHVDLIAPDTCEFWIERSRNADHTRPANFYLLGTGHDIPDHFLYVGTVRDGAYVWHLYGEYL